MASRATYCFGGAAGAVASAAGAAGAALPSAGAAAAPSAGAAGVSAAGAAGAVALSVAAGAGGAAAVSVLAASCFAQAVSISAATSALRASLVFIDRYPEEKPRVVGKRYERVRRSASPCHGVAGANSIESPRDLKQLWHPVCLRGTTAEKALFARLGSSSPGRFPLHPVTPRCAKLPGDGSDV